MGLLFEGGEHSLTPVVGAWGGRTEERRGAGEGREVELDGSFAVVKYRAGIGEASS
jgi:hypothetical protein